MRTLVPIQAAVQTTSPLGPVVVVPRTHVLYPSALADLSDPPTQIAYVGALPDFGRAVAIVGTRRSDQRAERLTYTLAGELAQAGFIIVSGGAAGIDSWAHRGAMEAGGITVAVLPTGLGQPYPPHNRALFERIVERGCVMTEHPDDVPAYPSNLLARNRLVAALTQITVVTQAPFKSGAMSTAAHAKGLGRPLMAVPYGPWEERGQGCLDLVARGARICRSSADVLTLAAPEAPRAAPRTPRRTRKSQEFQWLDADQRAVYEALSEGPLGADELCERAALSAPVVQRAVLMLLLSSVIQEVGSGRYMRADYP